MVKTLTVTKEAYERLASKKGPNESFSDVIMNLTGKASLLDIVGAISEKEAAEVSKAIRERRRAMRKRIDRTAGELNDS